MLCVQWAPVQPCAEASCTPNLGGALPSDRGLVTALRGRWAVEAIKAQQDGANCSDPQGTAPGGNTLEPVVCAVPQLPA